MAELDPVRPPIAPEETARWAGCFELLGDETRLALLSHMHLHPGATVSELAEAAGVTADTASQALRGLRKRGWVVASRDGRQQRYRLTDEVAHGVLHWLGHSHEEA